jgi:hypothetical protein
MTMSNAMIRSGFLRESARRPKSGELRFQKRQDFYNFNRPHGGLGGQAPYERLREKTRTSV